MAVEILVVVSETAQIGLCKHMLRDKLTLTEFQTKNKKRSARKCVITIDHFILKVKV